ncbi:MAG: type I pantothenate kinase [Gammaproteobacteria bacterium]
MATSLHLTFSRDEWSCFRSDTPLILTETELAELRGFNENISLDEVADIYLPLARLINLYVAAAQDLHKVSSQFLDTQVAKVPYIVGVSGSVGVGKSTTSRILQALLSRWPNSNRVELVTTDSFLYPNAVLEERGLMERKGFPESFDRQRFMEFLFAVKSGTAAVNIPVYSHEYYDIVPNEFKTITQPDILIVEGLNILQASLVPRKNVPKIFISDLLDFTIYVDAPLEIIELWYLERFMAFRAQAINRPDLFFHRFALWPDEKAYTFAKNIWKTINETNLLQNILPYKYRARLILEKTLDHKIKQVRLRRL